MTSSREAESALRSQLKFIKDMGGGRTQQDAAIARNVLHEDLGYYDGQQSIYNLDDDTRDRLITHARQDAAHAVISAASIYQEVLSIKRRVAFLMVINVGLLITALLVAYPRL